LKQHGHRVVAGPASGLNRIVDVTPAHIARRQPGPIPASQHLQEDHGVYHPTRNGVNMPTTTDTSRTAHLLALMKKGDDAFNARDFAALVISAFWDAVLLRKQIGLA
jgi:hypothetical protein